jgi:2-C-methyl-D-erythritol 4-phosphate cytidylyltransferase
VEDVHPDETDPPLGVLPLGGRTPLVFELLHGIPLYLHALRALVQVVPDAVLTAPADATERVRAEVERAHLEVRVLAEPDWWDVVRRAPGRGLLVHDALCPLASPEFLASVCRLAANRPDVSVAASRPVTDTVKTAVEGRIQGTIDREGLVALTSPILIAAPALAAAVGAGDRPGLDDFSSLLVWLRALGPVELVTAPSLARRVDDASAVNLLECVDELDRTMRAAIPDHAP